MHTRVRGIKQTECTLDRRIQYIICAGIEFGRYTCGAQYTASICVSSIECDTCRLVVSKRTMKEKKIAELKKCGTFLLGRLYDYKHTHAYDFERT